MVDLVHLDIERERHVMTHDVQPRMTEDIAEVGACARIEIVDDEYVMTFLEKMSGQV